MEKSIYVSFCIIAIYQTFQPGMIFHNVCKFIHKITNKWLGEKKAEWIRKPICGCIVCMSSVWTVLLSPFFGILLFQIPMIILIVCGMNTVYVKLVVNHEK
jgi:hypothetical protein